MKSSVYIYRLILGTLTLAMVACGQDAQPAFENELTPYDLEPSSTSVPLLVPTISSIATQEPTKTPRPTATTFTPTPIFTHTPSYNANNHLQTQDEKGFEVVFIPAGTFQMGITESQVNFLCATYESVRYTSPGCDPVELYPTSFPPQEVTLTDDYWIDVFEVSLGQYETCVEADVCTRRKFTLSFYDDEYHSDPEYYVNYPMLATYEQAETFCRDWRGGRLPTDAEWEFGARGTDGRLWPWDNTLPSTLLMNYSPMEMLGEGVSPLVEVGSYPSGVSPFGLYDMAGNIDEWVSVDSTEFNYRDSNVVRGGGYWTGPDHASTFARIWFDSENLAGIRCVKDAQ